MNSATKSALIFLLLGCVTSLGQPLTRTDTRLDTDNIQMIGYLKGLTDSRVGAKLAGISLQDGTLMLKNAVFLGSLTIPSKRQHIYTFRIDGRDHSYVWIDRKGAPLTIPQAPMNKTNEYAFILSGDLYKSAEIRPGAGVVFLTGGTRKWLQKLKAESKALP